MPAPRSIFLLALVAITAVSAAFAVKPSAKPQEVFAPFWTSDPGWETELQLKNNLPSESLTVTPVLRLASGEEVALDPVTIAPNRSAPVEINQALLQHSPTLVNQSGSYGSAALRFTSFHPRNLTASPVISLHGSPIEFHAAAYPAVDSEPFPGSALAGSREGIWWQPRVPGSDVLILSNSAQKALASTSSPSGAAGKPWKNPQPLTLAAHQTVRLDLRELVASAGLTGQYGGIRFEVPANAGALGSVHLMYDELAKSSSALEMFTRTANPTTGIAPTTSATASSTKPWTTRAPMLALRNPDPFAGLPAKTVLQPTILVRNTTVRQVAANITLAWRGDSGKGQVKLPPLNMAPFATQQLPIGAMQKQLGIPDDAHWALVTLTSSTAPNDVIASASSYDASGRYNLQSPFSPTVAGHFAGGEWRADSTHNHILSVTNSGQEPADTLLALHYANGAKTYEMQQSIQPGDQMWVNLASLIRDRVPDRKGNVLPADLTFGTYDVQQINSAPRSLALAGLAVDQTWGYRIAPPDGICCYDQDPGWNQDLFDLALGDTVTGNIDAIDSCGGSIVVISSSFPDWFSDDTSVAVVSKQKIQAVGVGTTTGSADGHIFVGDGGYCAEENVQENTGITVPPSVTMSYNPGFVYIGQGDPTVAQDNLMGGTGTPSGGTYQWSSTASGISFDNTAGDPVHITATAYTRGTNDNPITLSYTYNGAAAATTVKITQRIFKYLAGDSVILLTSYNGPSTYGYLYQATYNVFANPGGVQVTTGSGISTYENVTQISSNTSAVPIIGQGGLNANSQLIDNPIKLLSTTPLPPGLSIIDSQTLGVGGIYVRTNTLTYSAAGVTVTSNGPYN